ncbi:SCP2 sterol-binding domain-containing protein [Hahella sp. CR1]|uniref:ubiquinone biosynthesis accessory factor UbiJ n=1 Tax=Hahella sp. CR1 TaxID=2992807 RepID=UPI002442E2C1|nr:SCP2 sterol-binding domain-containing protein [Hahella sp. CR1]MDG9669856.1 SCP2 sterol-binding domain-containing protein [Hahella sp. CR1]
MSAFDPLLLTALNATAERIAAEILRYDAGSAARLAELDGKWAQLSLTPFNLSLYVRLGERPRFADEAGGDVDLIIQGSPGDFLSYLQNKGGAQNIHIQGDMGLAQRIAAIANNLEVDWEAKLAEHLGDMPAHFLGTRLRGFGRWVKHVGDSFRRDAEEYVHHEARTAPSKDEMNYWADEVDRVRMDYDRLEARLQRLQQALNPAVKDTDK